MNKLNAMKSFLILGDLTNKEQTISERVKYKERIVFATMKSMIPQWEKPSDWDDLSDETKLYRLEKLEQIETK
tara:strand:+ start:575 stop:793 length:219 start_codon:yes stop_codon:yes gene_type:complete